jgi:hypothetical protein
LIRNLNLQGLHEIILPSIRILSTERVGNPLFINQLPGSTFSLSPAGTRPSTLDPRPSTQHFVLQYFRFQLFRF